MAEQQRGVSLSLCPHEAQSLGMRIHVYKSGWAGHVLCCLPFSPLPSSSAANGGGPRGGSCLPARCKDSAGQWQRVCLMSVLGSRLPERMKLTMSLKVNTVSFLLLGLPEHIGHRLH